MSHLIDIEAVAKTYKIGNEVVNALKSIDLSIDKGGSLGLRQIHPDEYSRLPGYLYIGQVYAQRHGCKPHE